MTDDIHVRIGAPGDLEQVMELARMMHEEIGITAFRPEKVLPEIYAALHMDHGLMGVIGPPGGPLEGGILLRIGNLFYSDEDVLEEKGLFTHPDFRNLAGRGRALCEWSKSVADRMEMPLLIGVQGEDVSEQPEDVLRRVLEAVETQLQGKLRCKPADFKAVFDQVARSALKASRTVSPKLRLYERHFGKPMGAVFLYRPPAHIREEAA